jgi:uncharacterized membrane protein YccC
VGQGALVSGPTPKVNVHLIPFLEILAAVVVAPVLGFYGWRGWQRRRRDQATR